MLSRLIWLKLPQDTKKELSSLLGIPRTGGVQVEDNQVVCDGYTDEDLLAVTLEKLQTILACNDNDFYKLFNTLVERIEKPAVIESVVEAIPIEQPKKRGRHKGWRKNNNS